MDIEPTSVGTRQSRVEPPDTEKSIVPTGRDLTITLGRRRFLTHLVAAPVLTIAIEAVTSRPAAAEGLHIPVPSGPAVEELFDVGDLLKLSSQPTMAQLRIEVSEHGTATLDLPRIELGQGITTAVSILIAEEMDLPMSQVRVTLADARPELLFNQLTAGSATMRTFYDPVRALAAAARARLVAAAARRWGVGPGQLSTHEGFVEAADGQRLAYGELSAEAATVDLAGVSPQPKPVSAHRLIGRPQRRVDAREIVTGEKTFTMDIRLPGMKCAMVRRAPTIKGKLVSLHNAQEVRAIEGVVEVVELEYGVAVVADTFERARRGCNAVKADFTSGPIPNDSNASVRQQLRSKAQPLAVPPLGAATVEGEFDWAPANHAPLETECAVADVRADRAEVWGGFQAPIVAKQKIALALGMPQDAVTAHVVAAGGGFGRKVFYEAAFETALISRAVGRPIKLMWHRTTDMRHGRVRPANFHRIRATVVANQIVSYEQRVAGVATDVAPGFGEILTETLTSLPPDAQRTAGRGALSQTLFLLMLASPYNFGVYSKTLNELGNGMPTSAYRSVPCPTARGCEEIIVDELAATVGLDPVEFRRTYVKSERGRAVIEKTAELGQWGRSTEPGFSQGFGYHAESRSFSACVVELDGRDRNDPHVVRATIVLDVGLPINPSGLEAQMQGALAEAVSLTLRAGLHLEKGLPLEGSYHNYHWTRQAEYPTQVDVHIMPANGETMGGAGEVGIAAPTGAIANAFARATGIKPRSFPLVFPVDFEPYPPEHLPAPSFRQI